MKVKALSELIEIWKLVDKDPGTLNIVLNKNGASIAGMHVAATSKLSLPLKKAIMVHGESLVGAIKLFPQKAQLSFKDTGKSLVLSAKGRRVVLLRTTVAIPTRRKPTFAGKAFSRRALLGAIPFMRSITQGGVMQPILTGIKFSKGKKKNEVVLEATDASVRTGRLSIKLPVEVKNEVVPAADLEQALSLLTQKRMQMQFIHGSLEMADGKTTIRISLLNGEFPDLSKMPLLKTYENRILLKRSQLDNAVKAAALLDDDRLVTLNIKEGRASWIIRGQEKGGFREPIGPVELDDINIIFDSHWLDTAQDIGAEFTLCYKDNKAPVLFFGNGKSLWMSPVVKTLPELDD